MTLMCPACGTENRSVAKFCIECIAKLPVDFQPTQLVAAPTAPEVEGPPSMPAALAAFASAASSPPLPLGWGESPVLPGLPPPPPPRRRRPVTLALLAAALLLAAGWWLGRLSDDALADAARHLPQPGRAASGPVQVSSTPAEVAPVLAPPAAPETSDPGEASRVEQAALPAEAMAMEPAAPLVMQSVHVAAAPARPAKPELFSACSGLGFVRESRCKVDQCEQAANRRRPECAEVLAQQRRMDGKRNPHLAD